MSDKLMDTLRESLLLERARKIHHIAKHYSDDACAVEMIKAVLRDTRDEGIQTGHDQTVKYSEELEKAS